MLCGSHPHAEREDYLSPHTTPEYMQSNNQSANQKTHEKHFWMVGMCQYKHVNSFFRLVLSSYGPASVQLNKMANPRLAAMIMTIECTTAVVVARPTPKAPPLAFNP